MFYATIILILDLVLLLSFLYFSKFLIFLTDGCTETGNDNPFVRNGSKKDFKVKPTKDGGFFLRIDMSEVTNQDSRVWVVDREVRFLGRARKIMEHDESRRDYLGSISLRLMYSNCRIHRRVVHDMKDGVLRILISPA